MEAAAIVAVKLASELVETAVQGGWGSFVELRDAEAAQIAHAIDAVPQIAAAEQRPYADCLRGPGDRVR